MNLRVVHLADLHGNHRARAAEARRITAWLVEDIRRQEPDLIVDAGDLHDEHPTPDEEDAAARFYHALAEIAPIVGVTGNHAPTARPIPRRRIPVGEHVPPPRHPITVLDRPGVVYVAGAAIACLPWPRRGHLMAAMDGAPIEQRRAGGVAALEDVLRGMGAELAAHDGPRILVAHALVRSARVGHGQPLAVGQDFEVGLEQLALSQADYAALGHIHKPQSWTWGRDGRPEMHIVYAGSPFANDFGDVDRKSYVVAELDGRDGLEWRRVLTPATPLVLAEATYDGQKLVHDCGLGGVLGAEVRLRYHVDGDHREAAERAAEAERDRLLAAGAAAVTLEAVVRPTVRARVPEIATAYHAAEQWAMWARSTGVDEERIARCVPLIEELETP